MFGDLPFAQIELNSQIAFREIMHALAESRPVGNGALVFEQSSS
jgi:hypothetical protein